MASDREKRIRGEYTGRIDRAAARARVLSRRSSIVSWLRLAALVAATTCLALPYLDDRSRSWATPVGLACSFVFIFLVAIHRRLSRGRKREEELVAINNEAIHRMNRAWSRLPVSQPPAWCVRDPRASDLNLFGRASLFHLLAGDLTPYGRRMLAAWLLEAAPPEEVRARQDAVKELAPYLDARQEARLHARRVCGAPPDAESFLRWAEGDGWLRRRPWLSIVALALTGTLVLAVGALALGVIEPPILALLALLNLTFGFVTVRLLHPVFSRVEARLEELRAYRSLLCQLETLPGTAARLVRLRDALRAGGGAHRQVGRLEQLIALAEVRYSPTFHFLLQGFLFWDFHVLHALERWQSRAGRHVRGWMEAMGEAEALMAFASAAHDHPDWTFPDVVPDGALEGYALAHPLLRSETRVANDVTVGPPGNLLLVTGSNMSGKSTLLRAIGANVTLALAGGPACARALRLPPVALATSFVVEDSLADGVSYFLAELRRLKEIVSAAEAQAARRESFPLILLDEVLRGTNSAERQIAVRVVVNHLLDKGAMVAISTHDSTFAEAEGLADRCRPVHLRECIHGEAGAPTMTFDYRLREGIAPTSNALLLLRLVGLDRPEGEGLESGASPRVLGVCQETVTAGSPTPVPPDPSHGRLESG